MERDIMDLGKERAEGTYSIEELEQKAYAKAFDPATPIWKQIAIENALEKCRQEYYESGTKLLYALQDR